MVHGPSVFSGATGNPNSAHKARVVARASLQRGDSCGPRRRKSSR